MIVFDLACACGFQFEGWFRDHEDFSAQNQAGLLQCPECGGAAIRKILSPVASMRGSGEVARSVAGTAESEVAQAALGLLRAMHQLVEKYCEDVGHHLAHEAMKIHYGDAEPRNLRGHATPEEERVLEQEGITLLKLPVVPLEDENPQ